MSKHEHGWTRWLTRATMIVVAAALLAGTGASPLLDGQEVEASKKRDRGGSAPGEVIAEEIQSFSNSTPVAITDNTTSTPSSITVSGFETPLADVNVNLNTLTHSQPADIDILLVGPGGQMTLLMSNTHATGTAANDSLLIDDQAANQLPLTGNVVSGPFQPTNYDFGSAPDTFSSPPAPVANPPSGSALAVFNGTNPNGTWTLFIDDEDDDTPDSNGSLGGGWSLTITSASGVPNAARDSFQAQAGKSLSVAGPGVLDNDSDPDGDTLTAVLAGQPTKGNVTLEADGSFTYKSKKTAKGTDSFTYLAQDATGLRDLGTVTIQIKKAKKKKGRR
jgi:subtilisin-like proprotein convertase family protein